MRKFYFVLAAILLVGSAKANVITGNFSICLPGPNTSQLSASVPPAPITATTPWFSLNPAVATISSTGLVTAVGFGTTTISYTDNLGYVYSENVYVSTFPTIYDTNGTSTCQAGTLQLEGSLFPNASTPWTSLTPAIATVDALGLVTGVSGGIATIQYMNLGGCTTTIPITINSLLSPTITCGATTPTSITFNWTSVPGASNYVRSYQLNGGPFVSGGNGATLTYTLNGLSPGDTVNFYVAPSGSVGSCFQVGLANCSTIPCPNAGVDGSTSICETDTTTINLFSLITGEDSGGVWTRIIGTGGTFNAALGTFTPSMGSTTSVFAYTITGSNPCPNDTSLATITINQQPNAGIDGSTTICDSSVAAIDLFSLITGEQVGGTWTRVSGVGGTFVPESGIYIPAYFATSSLFVYTINGFFPCMEDASMAYINITHQPNAGFDGCISVSDESISVIDLFSLISNGDTGGTWTRTSGVGGTFFAVAGTYVPSIGATTSTFTYTVNAVAPCVSESSVATVIVNGPPCGSLSAANFDSDLFEYYPNPITDVLNLKFTKAIKNVQIVNVLGQEVFSSDFNEKDLQINLSHLNSGTYIVKAMITDTVRTFKIVKN